MTVAKELAQSGKEVTVLEAGAYPKMGTERGALSFYTGGFWGPGEFSREGVELLRTEMVGGHPALPSGTASGRYRKSSDSMD